MPVRIRILLLALVAVAGVSAAMVVEYRAIDSEVDRLERASEAIALAQRTSQLIHALQKERGLSGGQEVKWDPNHFKNLVAQRKETDEVLSRLRNAGPHSLLSSDWITGFGKELQDMRTRIDTGRVDWQAIRAFYTSGITHALEHIAIELGTLPTNWRRSSMAIVDLASARENLGLIRATITRIYTRGKPLAPELVDLARYYGAFNERLRTFFLDVPDSLRGNAQARLYDDVYGSVSGQTEAVLGGTYKPSVQHSPLPWWNASTHVIDTMKTIENSIYDELVARVAQEVGTKRTELASYISVAFGFALLVALLTALTVKRILHALAILLHTLDQVVSRHDFGLRIRDRFRKDEFGKISRSINDLLKFTDTVIKEKERARDVLQESEARFRALVDASAQIVWTTDATGAVVEDSPSWRAFTGQTYEQWKGWGWLDAFHPEDRERTKALWKHAIETRTPVNTEYRIHHVSGEWRWTAVRAVPLLGADGTVHGWVGMNNDITERKRAEQALHESEARLNEAQRIAHIGSWELNLVDNLVVWSEECYRIFEIDLARFGASYEAFLETVHPDDRAAVDFAYTNAVKTRSPYSIDHRLLLSDGRIKHVHEQCETYYEDGRPLRSVGTVQDITERKQAEQALRRSEEQFRLLFESVAEGVFGVDPNGDCMFINPAGLRLLGYDDAAQLIGKPVHPLIHHTLPDGSPCRENQCRVYRAFRENKDFHADNERFWRGDGSSFDVEYRSHPIRSDGTVVGSVVTFADISERKQTEKQLRQAATVFDNTMDAIVITDAVRNIVAVNQAFTNITGFAPDDVLGKNPRLQQSGRHDEAFYQGVWKSLERTGQWQGEIWNRRKNGEVYPAWENISVVKDDHGQVTNYVSVLSDISLIKQAEEQLRQLAHHDALTGLPNRLAFAANLEQALERAKRHQQKVALLFLDLDRFKLINDTMGHAAGDKMLQIVSARLKGCVRAEDTVARLGGDEFTVILDEIAQAEDAAILADKIIEAIAEPMLIEDREVVTSTSIGISIYPDDARNTEDLAKAADAAMYRAKERGRQTYEFYTMELTTLAQEHLAVEDALRQALARNEFVLHYQPLLDLKQRKIVGVEALLRWQHPQKGLIGPDTFIAVAEESGLIQPIGDWVLREACMQAAAWRAAGLPPLRVAINLSGRQILHDGLANTIQDTLKQCGLSAGDLRLELEVSERMLYTTERSVDVLQQLRSLGVNIAIDDFGTGYSSLSQLKRLPVDTLKIDRIFMQDIPDDPGDQAIAAAIISLGHTMDLKVVAEGVETTAQLGFLETQGCDEVQGFLFSKPVSHDEIRHLVEAAG